MKPTYDHPHVHLYDSEHFHQPETKITMTVLGCKCGAIASVGEGKPGLIWEPWRDDEVRRRTERVA